jgi:hypothetical protein
VTLQYETGDVGVQKMILTKPESNQNIQAFLAMLEHGRGEGSSLK